MNESAPVSPPLILTLALDEVSTSYFDALRKAHFPAAINYLTSHLTLFHKLPPNEEEAFLASHQLVESLTSFDVEVTGLMSIGRGVAFRIASDELNHLHHKLKQIWKPWLTPQDNQGFRPHITVQNKVDPAEAKELLTKLQADFTPFRCKATGINCFEYLNGPWKLKTHISMRHA